MLFTQSGQCLGGGLTPYLSLIGGVLVGVFAEPVRNRIFRPVLHATFDPLDEGCKAYSETGVDRSGEGWFVRAKVVNSKGRLAKSCRAFLVDVERRNARGDFVATSPKFGDALPLTWSSQPGATGEQPMDVPTGISLYVDIVSTNKNSTDFGVHSPLIPFRYGPLFDNKPKALRFSILVTGDGVKPDEVKVIFDWKGKWDTFDVADG